MDKKLSSPLSVSVHLKDGCIYVLDETSLPWEEKYLKVKTLNDALKILSEMKTRAFGQVLLFFYVCVLLEKEIIPEDLASLFHEKRPTFDFKSLAGILRNEIKKDSIFEDKKSNLTESVERLIDNFSIMRKKRAENLALNLPDPASVLTLCNVSGEFVYLYEAMQNMGKKISFIASETRPYLQGARLTFWELNRLNIPVKLICDNQAAWLMERGMVNCVVVGSDRCTKKGDIINKIGTYSLARLASYYQIPFYVLNQFPLDIPPEKIPIEERDYNEVFLYLEGRGRWPYSLYPSFDLTKQHLISGWFEISGEVKLSENR
ncbi:MAG: hypothetical protein SV062_08635 [Thermodesulfobacteriota bacterium]|nr:hypothetical protein [Thermodesulfobacteriota bacterium]